MPYKDPVASILIKRRTKERMEEYKDCSWNEFMERVLILIEREVESA